MTGRTHDLAAFTALNIVIAMQPLPDISPATAAVAFGANFLGGLAPDMDQPTGKLWNKMRGGPVISRLIVPLLGGHRFLSHSVLGVFLWGWFIRHLLDAAAGILKISLDMTLVWWAFMIGYVSHLLIDMLTREGVPWLFPLPWRFGIPPIRAFRIKTGGLFEKTVLFPVLMAANVYVFYTYRETYLLLLRKLLG